MRQDMRVLLWLNQFFKMRKQKGHPCCALHGGAVIYGLFSLAPWKKGYRTQKHCHWNLPQYVFTPLHWVFALAGW